MPKFTRNFVAGKMNKTFDERVVPNGEYIDAMNIRMVQDSCSIHRGIG